MCGFLRSVEFHEPKTCTFLENLYCRPVWVCHHGGSDFLDAMGRLVTAVRPYTEPSAFVRMMSVICVVASLAHIAFLSLLVSAGATSLAWVNVGSVFLYGLAYVLVQRRVLVWALNLIAGEIFLHGVVASWSLGLEAGFQFYILLIIPVGMLTDFMRLRLRALTALAAGVVFMALDYWLKGHQPPHPLAAETALGLYYFNLAVTLVILGFLAFIYQRLVGEAEARLQHLACTDPLTQLHNRRFVLDVAHREAAIFARSGQPLTLIVADVDHFKRINDEHGHEVGDAVLTAIAAVLRAEVREVDHVARWGGEEFLILLPGTAEREAHGVADRLRRAVEQIRPSTDRAHACLSMTLGMSVLQPGETIAQALARADKALYQGKQAGRNRVILASAA